MSLWSQMARGAGDIIGRLREVGPDVALGMRDGFSFPRGLPNSGAALRAGQELGKVGRYAKDNPWQAGAAAGVGAGAGLGLKRAFGDSAAEKIDDATAVQRVIELQQREGRRFTMPEIVEILTAQGMEPEQARAVASRVMKARG